MALLLRHIKPNINFVMLKCFVKSLRTSWANAYIAIYYCAHFFYMAYIGNISESSHIMMRFIRSHIAFWANARANC